jgi:D-inositol-3-phosphate glycosyltransferase
MGGPTKQLTQSFEPSMPDDKLRIAVLKSRRVPMSLAESADGGSINAIKVVEELCRRGHDVHVFTRSTSFDHKERPGVRMPCGATLWEVRYQPSPAVDTFLRDHEEGQSFLRGVERSAAFAAGTFDRMHVHHWTSGVTLSDVVPEDMPLIFTPHLLPSEKARGLETRLADVVAATQQHLLERAGTVIALSVAEFAAIGPEHAVRTRLVPNGVDDEFFAIRPTAQPVRCGAIKLGSIGRICAQKGQDVLLDAVELLISRGWDISVDLVGQPYDEPVFEAEIRSRSTRGLLAGRVRMLDDIVHGQVSALLQDWDIYLQPSRYESQGIALLEAMAAARVVVAAEVPAVTEYLVDGVSGFTIGAPLSGERLAIAIERALTDPNWESLTKQARKVASGFSWDSTVGATCDLIEGARMADSWLGGRHSCKIATTLRERAVDVTARLLEKDTGTLVLLVGSAARGPARPGSDLDLAIITRPKEGRPLGQEWYADSQAPLDLKYIDRDEVIDLASASEAEFLSQSVQTALPDLLNGAVRIGGGDLALMHALATIESRRNSDAINGPLANLHRAKAQEQIDRARRFAAAGALADAQLALHLAAQDVLAGALISYGWRVQGAKRRPEIAAEYVRRIPRLAPLVEALSAVVGFAGIRVAEVAELVEQRRILRHDLVAELIRLNAPGHLLERALNHMAAAADDYYLPALTAGFHKGVVNHIRCFSGVPKLPADLAAAAGVITDTPATWILDSAMISSQLIQRWMLLCPVPTEAVIDNSLTLLDAANDQSARPSLD